MCNATARGPGASAGGPGSPRQNNSGASFGAQVNKQILDDRQRAIDEQNRLDQQARARQAELDAIAAAREAELAAQQAEMIRLQQEAAARAALEAQQTAQIQQAQAGIRQDYKSRMAQAAEQGRKNLAAGQAVGSSVRALASREGKNSSGPTAQVSQKKPRGRGARSTSASLSIGSTGSGSGSGSNLSI